MPPTSSTYRGRLIYLAILLAAMLLVVLAAKLRYTFNHPGETTTTNTPGLETQTGMLEICGQALLIDGSVELRLYLVNREAGTYTFRMVGFESSNYTVHVEFGNSYLVLGPQEFVELRVLVDPKSGSAVVTAESTLYEMKLNVQASMNGSLPYRENVLLSETWWVDDLEGAGFNPVDLSILNVYTGPDHGYVAFINVSVERGFLKGIEAKLFAYHDELLANKVLAGNLTFASLALPACYKPIEVLGREVTPTLSRLTVYYETYEDESVSVLFNVAVVQVPSLKVSLYTLTGDSLETYVPLYRPPG